MRSNDGKTPLKLQLGDKGALLLVCDGMGGAAAGEVASQMAVDSIYEALTAAEPQPRDGFARLVRRAVERANERIFIQSRDNQSERGMGTTCTAAALVDETLVVGQIGDSRCYILRDGKLAQVTKDQSLAWQLIEAGAMTAEEAKAFEHANIILQALGVQERVEVVLSQVAAQGRRRPALLRRPARAGRPTRRSWRCCVTEPDLQKAADSADPEGARPRRSRQHHRGAGAVRRRGAQAAAARGHRRLRRLRPGPDQRPELRRSRSDRRRLGAGARRSSERLPQELLAPRTTSTKAEPADRALGRLRASARRRPARRPARCWRSSSSALVAAAAGGIFVMKCERDQAARADGRGAP